MGEIDLAFVLKTFQITHVIQNERPELYEELVAEFSQNWEFQISSTFQGEFALSQKVFQSRSALSEEMIKTHFIEPFLLEVWRHHPNLWLWQGMKLPVTDDQQLTREPDYFVTKKSSSPEVPYCIIGEAKQQDAYLYKGWGQALDAMRAVQILNKREASLAIPIYGVVSNGLWWQFGKFVENHFVIAAEEFIRLSSPVNAAEKILVLLDIVFAECEKNMSKCGHG